MSIKKDAIAFITEFAAEHGNKWRAALYRKSEELSMSSFDFDNNNKHNLAYLGCGVSRVAFLHIPTSMVIKYDFRNTSECWRGEEDVIHANKREVKILNALKRIAPELLAFFPVTVPLTFKRSMILIQEDMRTANDGDEIDGIPLFACDFYDSCAKVFDDLHHENFRYLDDGTPIVCDWGMYGRFDEYPLTKFINSAKEDIKKHSPDLDLRGDMMHAFKMALADSDLTEAAII